MGTMASSRESTLGLGIRMGQYLTALLRYQETWLNFGPASARGRSACLAHSARPSHQRAQSRFWAPLLLDDHASL